ncbi:ATP-dependent 6-phosphofructokinase 6-like [Cannabis sativa]|uniref:ATP-dependent 6-phosphofructokinase 6-like n=1 Tax=Cannabis sativa TaxID=3483 RepID=UPI0029C9ECD0|nr:ATP-dependent 6-phosphofructokinase 6-like [Cannabis sativa]
MNRISSSDSLSTPRFRCFDPTNSNSYPDHTTNHKHYIPTTTSNSNSTTEMITPKIVTSDNGYILEDVPHLSDYLTDLTTHPNPLQYNQTYSAVRQCFVGEDDSVAQQIVVQKDGPRGPHFRRAGPRQTVSFEPEEVNACIVTCGGLCPGLNTVIREIVCCLHHMYGVNTVHGIEGGYKGFYARNTIPLTLKIVNDIHKRGGTILGTSRGGHHTSKIVDSIQNRGINQVYIIGGDGTQKGASVIFEEIRRRGLKVAVAGIPKTIDNDIPVIDKSFGFDTAVEEAQRAINAAHVEAESFENGIGVVKLMGRHSGFIAMYASIASRDVDCCLIPESPFYLEGPGGLFEYIKRRLQENGHMVIVVAEGAGQENLSENTRNINQQDASGNKLLQDVGLWLTQKIKDYFSTQEKININLKYIDPTYMIRAIPSNASDNISCTLLAQSAVHGAMAGYTGFTIGPVNGRHAYIPFHRINERQNKVVVTDRMWARLLLGSTNQPSFLNAPDTFEDDHTEIHSENEESEENGYHGQFLICD